MTTKTPLEILSIIKIPIENIPPKKEYNSTRDKSGYIIQEHRYIWEQLNGKIPIGFVIHHINGNKKDNRISNLQCLSFQEHMKLHKQLKKNKLIPNNSQLMDSNTE